jgi:hypothetical protein
MCMSLSSLLLVRARCMPTSVPSTASWASPPAVWPRAMPLSTTSPELTGPGAGGAEWLLLASPRRTWTRSKSQKQWLYAKQEQACSRCFSTLQTTGQQCTRSSASSISSPPLRDNRALLRYNVRAKKTQKRRLSVHQHCQSRSIQQVEPCSDHNS